MLILNFSHPLTEDQKAQIKTLTGQEITKIDNVASQMDNARPFAAQIHRMVEEIALSPQEWQTLPILINPPSYNFAAVTLIAELHGRMGYFPAVIRIRPVLGSAPPRFEIAEIINLQQVREKARQKRKMP